MAEIRKRIAKLNDKHPRVLGTLDNWRFWMGVAYFGLVLVIVALWIAFGRLSADNARQGRADANHHADIVASADAQYQQCVKSIPFLIHTTRFVDGVRDVERVLIFNSKANHAATPKGTDLYRAQVRSIERLKRAYRASTGLNLKAPTLPQCNKLRATLLHRP